MAVFIVFLIVIVAIVLVVQVVRQNKRKEAIEELKRGAGYAVAVEIKDELSRKGYEVSECDPSFFNGEVVGYFIISSGEKTQGWSNYCMTRGSMEDVTGDLTVYNAGCTQFPEGFRECVYAIVNANIGLVVMADKENKSRTIPPFMERAADVIRKSGYAFEPPDWFDGDDVQYYLNVGL
jgi:hypothetical protein